MPEGAIRSKAICFPTTSSVLEKSSEALSLLASYREQHALEPLKNRKNVRQQRAKSMFAIRTNVDDDSNDVNGKQYSLDDFHSEFHLKFGKPNHGLKPAEELPQKQQQPPSPWQIIHKNFQDRVRAKSNAKM